MAEKCANCGTTIGKLETPYIWQEHVVCAACFGRLKGTKRSSRWPLIAGGVGLVVIVVVGAWLLKSKPTEQASINAHRDNASSGGQAVVASAAVAAKPPTPNAAAPKTTASTPAPGLAPVAVAPAQPKAAPVARPAPQPAAYTQGNLAKVEAELSRKIAQAFPTLTPQQLIGRRFVVAHNSAYADKPDQPFLSLGDYDNSPKYRDVAGKPCILVRTSQQAAQIKMEGSGIVWDIRYVGETGVPSEVIWLEEVEAAKKRWQGKTLWINGHQLIDAEAAARREIAGLEVAPCSPLQVIDVAPSEEAEMPVRLIVKTVDGKVGWMDVTLSESTSPKTLKGIFGFAEHLFEEDPHKLFPWPADTWKQIESQIVAVGMNMEQVRLSWGKPKDVLTTVAAGGRQEDWTYGDGRHVTFQNGSVTVIQQ